MSSGKQQGTHTGAYFMVGRVHQRNTRPVPAGEGAENGSAAAAAHHPANGGMQREESEAFSLAVAAMIC